MMLSTAKSRIKLRRLLPAFFIGILSIVAVATSLLYPGAWDDAYISFVYVKNCVAGNGLTYNGTVVQGYTNPLWVLLLVPFAYIGFDIPGIAIALGCLFGSLSLILVYSIGRRFGLSRWWALLPVVLLSLQIDFAYYLGKGLETSLFAFLFTLLFGVAVLAGQKSSQAILLGVVGGFIALCRTEGIILALGACLLLAVRTRWPGGVIAAGIVFMMAAPWFAWAHAFYGAWLPNPIFAKVPGISIVQAKTGLRYLFPLSWSGATIASIHILLLLAMIFVRDRRIRCLALLMLIWSIFIVTVGGDHIVGLRFLVPALPLIFLIMTLFARQFNSRLARILILLVPIMMLATRWSDSGRRSQAAKNTEARRLWIEVGSWFRENASPDSIIAVNPAGIIPYYSELTTVDMLGLNDFHIAHHGKKDLSLRAGHQSGDGAYVLSRQPDYVMFGAKGGLKPTSHISEKEIYKDPSFRSLYKPMTIALPDGETVIIYRRSE